MTSVFKNKYSKKIIQNPSKISMKIRSNHRYMINRFTVYLIQYSTSVMDSLSYAENTHIVLEIEILRVRYMSARNVVLELHTVTRLVTHSMRCIY